ncbi:hypothetical protein P609_15040 [Comamonas thiooxydans]|nr:hypothetical protein P609_15040 [Comamonas thiooxydans]
MSMKSSRKTLSSLRCTTHLRATLKLSNFSINAVVSWRNFLIFLAYAKALSFAETSESWFSMQ